MADAEFRYSDLLPTGHDDTPYQPSTAEGISTFEANVERLVRGYRQGPQTPEPGASCTNGTSTKG